MKRNWLYLEEIELRKNQEAVKAFAAGFQALRPKIELPKELLIWLDKYYLESVVITKQES